MEIVITKKLAEAVGMGNLKPFGLDRDDFRWAASREVALTRRPVADCQKILGMIEPHTAVRGTKAIARDIKAWLAIVTGDSGVKVSTPKQFAPALTEYIRANARRHLYKKADAVSDAYVCYYVASVQYFPLRRDKYSSTPEHVNVELVHEEFGKKEATTITFWLHNVENRTAAEALARRGFYLETPEKQEKYEEEKEKLDDMVPCIGLQCNAIGVADDDMDGNPKNDDDSWWRRRTKNIVMSKDGAPSRVVVDVYKEKGSQDAIRHASYTTNFWEKGEDADDEEDEMGAVEIPVHPYMAVFDLKRQLRLRIHVDYLSPYVYNHDMVENLVLPADVKDLVEMLLGSKGDFQDVISGKSGGAIVMCCGKPGTGKTLTAEVYAESKERPLYSVQASQLGLSPEDLEDELLKILARAERWKAILLIDEADVYVRTRGEDLHQNAIVGVFLRILEYYSGVMFMTTNRDDLVDDAILSRCLARIVYEPPTLEDQQRIWKVLAKTSQTKISDAEIKEIAKQNPNISGRDVKNLMKLARLVSSTTGEPITAAMIAQVKKFKPTRE